MVGHNDHLLKYPYNHYILAMRKVASGFSPLVALDRRSGNPLQKQVYEAFCAAIVGGSLHAGQRVPSSRSLAAELKISRIPVLTAYSQLLAEGYFETRTGSGTFVSSTLPDQWMSIERRYAPSSKIRSRHRPVSKRSALLSPFRPMPWLNRWGAFIVGQLAFEHFPFKVWARLVNRRVRNVRVNSLHYSDPMGCENFRATIAEYLRTTRAVNCGASQIMIVSGSQQALELTARVLLDPGDKVWIEEPGYRLARNVFAFAGCNLVPVPVDAAGMDVAVGIERSPRARAAYVTPSHQFPLGVTMSASRRLQLLDWAHSSGAWIIEDDYDSEYRYESMPISSLQGLDRNSRVIYIGTFSKTLFPSMRLGYVVIPPDLIQRFLAVRNAMDVCPPHFYQGVLEDFINEGHYARHIRRTRLVYGERRTTLVDAIRSEFGASMKLFGVDAGVHVAMVIPKGASDHAIAEAARRRDLWLWPLSSCYLDRASRQGFILGFGSTTPRQIPSAVQRLREVIEAQ